MERSMNGETLRRETGGGERYIEPIDVVMRVLGASYLGIFVTCFTFVPLVLELWRGPYMTTNSGFWEAVSDGIGIGLLFFPYAVLTTLPLVLFVIVVAVTCRRSVCRHTAMWCAAAPFAVWLVALALLDLVGVFEFSKLFGPSAWRAMTSKVSLIFLTGPIPSSVIFYWLWRRGEQAAATSSV